MKTIDKIQQQITPLLLLFGTMLIIACSSEKELIEEEQDLFDDDIEVVDDGDNTTSNDTNFTPIDWTSATHSKDAEPNFNEVFSNTEVKRLDIVITQERWQSMLNDMTANFGDFGSGGGRGGQGGGLIASDENPIFVPAEVFYEGKEWYRVGVRFKGNSSLQSAWRNGTYKMSFKLDFDEYEDTYPQIDNQRFYGFKKFSLKNNYGDDSMLREKVAADIFKNAGLAVSHTAFYTVFVDHGNGPTYFGLYTLTEEVDDTVIETQFSSDEGNLYKPDGDAATFASGTYDEGEYEKKTNEDEADFSDVKALYDIMNSATRTTNPTEWRNNLETIFDTDVFLKYLAVNTVIQNWDTYGKMTHNYYIYNNPATNKLTWIPWDNNESLQNGKQGGSLPLNFSGLNNAAWPIIGYMYADEVYKAKYDVYVKETIDNYFVVSDMDALYTQYAALVEPYATSENEGYTFLNSSTSFYTAISSLKSHVSDRNTAANSYLD
jgi:hypothetical protein